MYKFIIDPKTGNKVLTSSKLGKNVLKNYILKQKGSARIVRRPKSNKFNRKKYKPSMSNTLSPLEHGYKVLNVYYYMGFGIDMEKPLPKDDPYYGYKKWGHVAFQFEGESSILGYGPNMEEVDNMDDAYKLFSGVYSGKIYSNNNLIQTLFNENYTVKVVKMYVSNIVYEQYKNMEPNDYPTEINGVKTYYGVKKFSRNKKGVYNCLSYPIHILKPITFVGAGAMVDGLIGYDYVPDFGGALFMFEQFFRSNSKRL